jgi:hypothetical protein
MFNLYPKINFNVNEFDRVRAVDITNSFKLKKILKDTNGIRYFPYVVGDGERPDNVSYKFYKDPSYDWIILLSNDMYNIYDDWPKDSQTFKNYIEEKYGSLSSAMSEIKYYYDENGNIIDLITYNSLSATKRRFETVYEYEQRKNTQKSIIKLISSNVIGSIQSQLNALNIKPVL